jgi:hypothetical protein
MPCTFKNHSFCDSVCVGFVNTLLNDQWIIKEIREEIQKFLKSNENENTAYQNLLDTAKAVLRRKFIAMSAKI